MNIENSSRFIKSNKYFLLSTYFHILTFEVNQNVQEAPESYVIFSLITIPRLGIQRLLIFSL